MAKTGASSSAGSGRPQSSTSMHSDHRRDELEEPPLHQAGSAQYDVLRAQLVSGNLPPGTLLQETGIAAKNGGSRTPVREALVRLEQDGFLRRAPRGYRVR